MPPPRKELCRNFQRGSCQYGNQCKFVHATQQQPRPNISGSGVQTSSQFQRSNIQPQKPNPFGFGVHGSSQPRGSNGLGSKPNHFKPFENKWIRFSPINNGSSQASQQPDHQPSAANHNCTDPESCKRQITEDFEHERPLWKLTCYGHNKSSSCDIVGDISCEELRAAAYDDAKRGLSLQSIVERERSLLNNKLLEFESLLRNPYKVMQNPAIGSQTGFPGPSSGVLSITGSNNPPSVSSFGQLGASLNLGMGIRSATPSYDHRQPNTVQISSKTSGSRADNSILGSSFGTQLPFQSFGNSLASTASFYNGVNGTEEGPLSKPAQSPQAPVLASVQSPIIQNNANSASTAVGQLSSNADTLNIVQSKISLADDSIWLKEEWNPGEIPEEAPPDKYIF
ncbi:hypothetical protein NMG60_11025450 [Bertholletia excelsa]